MIPDDIEQAYRWWYASLGQARQAELVKAVADDDHDVFAEYRHAFCLSSYDEDEERDYTENSALEDQFERELKYESKG